MQSELKSKSIRAGIWSFIEAIGLRGMQFVVGIVLARLLAPEQFGLIGMLVVFTALAQTFLDSGFGAALIQRQKITEKDINSIFYFNIFASVVLVCCLFACSPWVADFYNQPVLSPLLRVLSLTLTINAFGLIQNVLLTKALNFKVQAKATVIASFVSGIVGVGMACLGYGVWSIVGQQISNSFFRTTLLWLFNSWRPALVFSFRSLRDMFHFGSKLLASGLLNTFFENIYLVVIGKLFPPADLGFFTRANNLQQLPTITLCTVIGRVTFPAFSTIQDEPERVKRGMKKALTMLAFINFPMMAGLAVAARSIVLVLLTDKWLPCVPYLQLLCFTGAMYPLHIINLNVLQALGRTDLFLRLEIIKKILIVLSIVVTFRWGILAMIYGQIITSLLSYYLNVYFNEKIINYSMLEQIEDLSPYLLAAISMAIPAFFIVYLPLRSTFFILGLQVAIGGFVYVMICKIFRFSALTIIQEIVLERLSRRKSI